MADTQAAPRVCPQEWTGPDTETAICPPPCPRDETPLAVAQAVGPPGWGTSTARTLRYGAFALVPGGSAGSARTVSRFKAPSAAWVVQDYLASANHQRFLTWWPDGQVLA